MPDRSPVRTIDWDFAAMAEGLPPLGGAAAPARAQYSCRNEPKPGEKKRVAERPLLIARWAIDRPDHACGEGGHCCK
jgi:hypothetical protein